MRLASIAMYAAREPLAEATSQLWQFLRDMLKAAGISDVPDALDHDIPYDAAWLDPQLLLSQTCGFPYVKRLRDRVRLVATPAYGFPGCEGATMCSFIVVRQDFPAETVVDLRGTRAAINSPDSNSGANLFRASVAPLAGSDRFFSDIVETGSHHGSLVAVATDRADVAAIDCITFENFRRFRPDVVEGIRVLSRTMSGPGLPLITRGDASDAEIEIMRDALKASLTEPSLAATREVLGLVGFEYLTPEDYEPLLQAEQKARSLGFRDF
jgi:ABC-type phosphate/phosphonate transport system substrate-binding protein